MAALSRTIQLWYTNTTRVCIRTPLYPTTPKSQHIQAWHDLGLGFFPFAHHYWGNHFVFFSWHYLDVSVHAVRLFILWIQIKILWLNQSGFLHSETSGSMLDWQLPEVFGSLPPPSSPLDAKASTKSPFKLITNLLVTHLAWVLNLQKFQRSQEKFFITWKTQISSRMLSVRLRLHFVKPVSFAVSATPDSLRIALIS